MKLIDQILASLPAPSETIHTVERCAIDIIMKGRSAIEERFGGSMLIDNPEPGTMEIEWTGVIGGRQWRAKESIRMEQITHCPTLVVVDELVEKLFRKVETLYKAEGFADKPRPPIL